MCFFLYFSLYSCVCCVCCNAFYWIVAMLLLVFVFWSLFLCISVCFPVCFCVSVVLNATFTVFVFFLCFFCVWCVCHNDFYWMGVTFFAYFRILSVFLCVIFNGFVGVWHNVPETWHNVPDLAYRHFQLSWWRCVTMYQTSWFVGVWHTVSDFVFRRFIWALWKVGTMYQTAISADLHRDHGCL